MPRTLLQIATEMRNLEMKAKMPNPLAIAGNSLKLTTALTITILFFIWSRIDGAATEIVERYRNMLV